MNVKVGLGLAFALVSAGNACAENVSGSLVDIICATCPKLKVVTVPSTYVVDVLAPGTQKVEFKKINGEMKMVRTDAWMGGSPVVFISKMTKPVASDVASLSPPDIAAMRDDSIVTRSLAPLAPPKADIKPAFNPDTYQLRLE